MDFEGVILLMSVIEDITWCRGTIFEIASISNGIRPIGVSNAWLEGSAIPEMPIRWHGPIITTLLILFAIGLSLLYAAAAVSPEYLYPAWGAIIALGGIIGVDEILPAASER